jgi:hypothetical protein
MTRLKVALKPHAEPVRPLRAQPYFVYGTGTLDTRTRPPVRRQVSLTATTSMARPAARELA